MKIGNTEIGQRAYVIAEIGFNHEGDLDLAFAMIDAAAEAGADAVKFQTYRAEDLVLDSVDHFEVIRHGELGHKAHVALAARAKEKGVDFLSTPYDCESVDLLHAIGSPAFKIASMDLTNLPLLRHAASKGKPLILSTGMAVESEVSQALETLAEVGCNDVVLLHCISKYPTDPADVNLRTMNWMEQEFGTLVGWSDHVLGNAVVFAATTLGACVIEKHFTTDKTLPGPDHAISMDPAELADLVSGVRTIEASLGKPQLNQDRPDRPEGRLYRRGLFARSAIAQGTVITDDMVACVRPEAILAPDQRPLVVGAVALVDIEKNQAFDLKLVGQGSLA
ncbi:MAG: N,N'-diacetyllegionaminate synthase [Planctomycetota bacterium]|jgi:N,N'-diacetyllegionaminate synthase